MQFGVCSPDFGVVGLFSFFVFNFAFLEYGNTVTQWNCPADTHRLRKLTLASSEPVNLGPDPDA